MAEAAYDLTPETPENLNDILTRIIELKDQEAELGKAQKALADQRKELEREGVRLMQDQGLERTGNAVANALVQHKKHPQVSDWEAFTTFIYEQKAAYLLQRRVSSRAIDELVEAGEEIPGIDFYEEDRLMVKRR